MKYHIAALSIILAGCASEQHHPQVNTKVDVYILPVSEDEIKVSASLRQETASKDDKTSNTINFPETLMHRHTGGIIRVKNTQSGTGLELTITPEKSSQGGGCKIHLESIDIPQPPAG